MHAKAASRCLNIRGPDGEEATTAAYHDFYQSILSQKENDSKSSD